MGREEIFTNIKAALRDNCHPGLDPGPAPATSCHPGLDDCHPGLDPGPTSAAVEPQELSSIAVLGATNENDANMTKGTVPFVTPFVTSELFIDLLVDYKATVECADDSSQIAVLVARFLKQAQAETCVVPPGLDPAWFAAAQTAGIQVRVDNPPLSKEELDQTSAVITAACLGMAETGTIVLDHRADQGRRIISLLPDTHICVIRSDQIAAGVSEAMVHLAPLLQEGQPLTWISGPSATSDIELSRVEGVHGPRNLYVILVT